MVCGRRQARLGWNHPPAHGGGEGMGGTLSPQWGEHLCAHIHICVSILVSLCPSLCPSSCPSSCPRVHPHVLVSILTSLCPSSCPCVCPHVLMFILMSLCPHSPLCPRVHTHLCVSSRPTTAPQLIPDGSLARSSPQKVGRIQQIPPYTPTRDPCGTSPLGCGSVPVPAVGAEGCGGLTSCNQGQKPPWLLLVAALGCCCPLQKISAAGSWPGSTRLTQCLEEPGQARISLPCCHLLPTLLLSLFLTPFPQEHCPGALALFLKDFSAWEEHWGLLRGQKFQDWASREEKDSSRRSPCANPPFDDLAPVTPSHSHPREVLQNTKRSREVSYSCLVGGRR